MTYLRRHQQSLLVTATGGAAWSTYTPVMNGYVEAISYRNGTTGTTASGISTDANLTLTNEHSSQVILNDTATGIRTFYPRHSIEDVAGATVAGFDRFAVADERIKIQVSSAGTASAGGLRGTLTFYLDGQIGN